MSRVPKCPCAGFTLLELVVALAIMSLVLTLAYPVFPKLYETARLNAAAHELVRDLRDTRTAAIAQNRALAVALDPERRLYRANATTERALPSEFRLTFAPPPGGFALLSAQRAETAGVTFFADGSSSGGEITITAGLRALRVDTDWLTGRSRILD